MSNQFVIDALDFVHNAGSLRGNVTPFDLERLRDYLVNGAGELAFSINGVIDKHGRPMLSIAVNGIVNLSCQRCLNELEHSLDLRIELLLVKNENELCRYDEDVSIDVILASDKLNTLALVEDEIILSLPISPRHTDIACQSTNRQKIHKSAANGHPFAALASIKQPH
jgi:uncharacterized protein